MRTVQSRTSMVGVATTFEVPPFSTVVADYGVHGYDVSYYVENWHRINNSANCEEWGYYPARTFISSITTITPLCMI